MSVLFLVPARGGSRGLPGKNLARVGGIPLVGRACRLARQAAARVGEASRVVCSTDDQAAAEAARLWGGEVPFERPAKLSTDEAKTLDVVRHAIERLGLRDEDTVVLMQPTSPLTECDDVLDALALHRKLSAPVVSVCAVEHPVQWSFWMEPNGTLNPVHPNAPTRRQDARQAYRLNGAIYVASAGAIAGGAGLVEPTSRAHVMPPERSIDIDVSTDLALADAILAHRAEETIRVGHRSVGSGHPCFVIAEAGVNHNGDMALARALIDAAVNARADAVKFQTFRAEKVVTATAPKAEYQKQRTDSSESQLDMVKRLELSAAQHRQLHDYCTERGIAFLSTPFDVESLELLCDLAVGAIKLGSGEVTHHDFLAQAAGTGLPILLSTGMSTLVEVDQAFAVLRAAGAAGVALFHCVSSYPTRPEEANLAAIETMRQAFRVPVGWSDHTLGVHVAVAAVARGASLIEKHLTMDRNLPGPDHAASLEPDEFRELVDAIRAVEAAIGDGEKVCQPSERNTADVARRSVHAAKEIAEGQVISRHDLVLLRPGTGIRADQLGDVVGRRAACRIPKGSMITREDLA